MPVAVCVVASCRFCPSTFLLWTSILACPQPFDPRCKWFELCRADTHKNGSPRLEVEARSQSFAVARPSPPALGLQGGAPEAEGKPLPAVKYTSLKQFAQRVEIYRGRWAPHRAVHLWLLFVGPAATFVC